MSDQTIFNQENNSSTQTDTNTASNGGNPSTNDQFADLLKGIKNERGEQKYASVQDAITALQHSQEYIPNLKTQLTEREKEIENLRREANRIKDLEEAITQLTQKQNDASHTTSPSFDPEKIAGLVEQTITAREAQKTQSQNIALVRDTIASQYGKDAETVFYSKAAEVGLSREQVNQLAATTPKAVFTLLGITDKARPNVSVTSSSVNSSAYQPKPDSVIGRNPDSVLYGAGTEHLNESVQRANKMVEELEAQGMSVYDLSDPKNYFKMFKK